MIAFFSALLDIATLVFAVSSMLSVGFAYTVAEIVAPLRSARAVVRALAANFALVPALALLVIQLVPLDGPQEIGLMLVATAAGAPFLIKLSATAGADLGLTATLLVLLLPVTVLYMPLVVPLLAPGADVAATTIAAPLVLSMLVPLGIGVLVRALRAAWAARLRPVMDNLSTVALIVLVLSILIANLDAIIGIGWQALVAAVLVVFGAFGIGYVLGGFDPDNREVLALGTGQRNIAAATVVATQAIGYPDTVSMVVVTFIVGLAILLPLARLLYRTEQRRHELG